MTNRWTIFLETIKDNGYSRQEMTNIYHILENLPDDQFFSELKKYNVKLINGKKIKVKYIYKKKKTQKQKT